MVGRPKGIAKTGGRKKGTPNKASSARANAVAQSGQTPLDYMLGVMRDSAMPPDVRLDAAKSAAPYVHPKLSAIEHKGGIGITSVVGGENVEQGLLELGGYGVGKRGYRHGGVSLPAVDIAPRSVERDLDVRQRSDAEVDTGHQRQWRDLLSGWLG